MKQFYPLDETKEAHTENVILVHITLPNDNIECDMAIKYSKIYLSQRHLYYKSTKIESKFRKQILITQ